MFDPTQLRRRFTRFATTTLVTGTLFLATACGKTAADPPRSDWMQPSELARLVADPAAQPPTILYVGPHQLWSKHIPGAIRTGEAGTPEGLAKVREAAAKLPREREVVVYCGCCATEVCPNIRPAYAALKEMGFTRVRVLELPSNFRTDWKGQGYPVEQAE